MTFERNLARVSRKLSQFFFFWNKLSRLEHVLFWQVSFASHFRQLLWKENFLVCHYLKTHSNGLFSRTTWSSWHQKGYTNLDFTEQEMMGWQWHQLDHMQIICTSLQTDNHASTSPLKFFFKLDALPDTQTAASKHWRFTNKFVINHYHHTAS